VLITIEELMPDTHSNNSGRDTNPDLITGEPGSHPVGTGVGAASGGATGAAIGAIAGPVGSAIGAVIGAVAGGLAGKGVAEAVDPTAEDTYWRENHAKQPYVRKDRDYTAYQPAYRTGIEGFGHHGTQGHKFEQAEPKLREHYEDHVKRANVATPLAWDEAKPAAKAAWDRVERGDAVRVPITEEQVKVGKREVEAGSVRIRKEVHTETVNTPVQLRREEVIVERVASNHPDAVPADAFQEGEIRVPLSREEAVVEKTAHVTGEVRVNKTAHTDTKNVQETVRKEEVKVENQGEARIERDR